MLPAVDPRAVRRALSTQVIAEDTSLGVLANVANVQDYIDSRRRQAVQLDLREEERKAYSLGRAVKWLIDRARGSVCGTTFESEVSQELDRSVDGLVVPTWALTRALTVGNPASAGYLVGTDTQADSVMLALRGRSVIASLPITVLPGCVGSVMVPVETAGPTAYVLNDELTGPTPSTPTVTSIAATPKSAATLISCSGKFITQAPRAADGYLSNSLLAGLGAKRDELVIAGSGVSGEPLGLLSTPGLATVTGTSLADAGVREFQTDLGNALGPDCGFVADQATASLLNGRQRFTGSSTTLWEGNVHQGVLGGWPAFSSPSVPSAHLLFGAWSNLVICEWGNVELDIDPYNSDLFKSGGIVLRAIASFDAVVRRPAAFALSTAVT
jgi:HK97 family phage major capsid protein